MQARHYRWNEVSQDHPVPLLHRKLIEGEQMLLARVLLEKDCFVAMHHHVSEQLAVVLSGHVRWTLGAEGPDQTSLEMRGREVLHLPANFPHGVVALEETEIIDILSPPGPMGVDSQKS